MLSEQKNNMPDSSNPWTEDPLVAYQNFLNSASQEVNSDVTYNRQVFTLFSPSTCSNKELEVHTHNGAFYPLTTALGMPLYCSKITIRNVNKAAFGFSFAENILPAILGIEANPKTAENLLIAYRNIVPREFKSCPQLAGPMGFKEYIIDGNKYGNKASITFIANSDFNQTPIKIVFENCKGMAVIKGLSDSSINQIFENKCNKEVFCLIPTLGIEKEAGNINVEQKGSPRMGR